MQCPECESRKIVKNGRQKDQQNYLCRNCNRQFIENYDQRGYSREMKRHCLILYCNGMGFRGIERSTGVCHNTVINWVKAASSQISEENYEIPETAQLDELFAKLILWTNFCWLKKSGKNPRRRKAQGNACQDNKVGLSTAVNSPDRRYFKMGDWRSLVIRLA